MKRWRVEVPAEWIIETADCEYLARTALDGYVGTLIVCDGDFLRNTRVIGGEHDSSHAPSQIAVARLVATIYDGGRQGGGLPADPDGESRE